MKQKHEMDRLDIARYKDAKRTFEQVQETITTRIDEIIDVIFLAFGKKRSNNHYWYFYDANEEDSLGTLKINDNDEEELSFVGSSFPRDFQKKSGWDYGIGFPQKFLFMSNDEIIEYIHKEIANEEKKKKLTTKQKKEEAKHKKEQLAKAVKSKLTAEELQALGIRL
jgi:hypothetical protein